MTNSVDRLPKSALPPPPSEVSEYDEDNHPTSSTRPAAGNREKTTSKTSNIASFISGSGTGSAQRSFTVLPDDSPTMSEWDELEDDPQTTSMPPSPTDSMNQREHQRKRKKRPEPTSPIVVVLYVVALYLVFQILTRSDENEILSHIPMTSSYRQSHSSPNMDVPQQYHLPYQFPPIPNPIPSVPKDDGTALSFFKLILGVIAYPFYLIVTVVIMVIPLLLNVGWLIKEILLLVLSPPTAILRVVFRTFIQGPWVVFMGILDMLYPVYVFLGSVIGVGVVLGLGAGWVGRTCLDWVLSWREGRKDSNNGRKGDAPYTLISSTPKSDSKAKSKLRLSPGSMERQRYRSDERSSRHYSDQSQSAPHKSTKGYDSQPRYSSTPSQVRSAAYTVDTPSPVRRRAGDDHESHAYSHSHSRLAAKPKGRREYDRRSPSSTDDDEIATPRRHNASAAESIALFGDNGRAYDPRSGGSDVMYRYSNGSGAGKGVGYVNGIGNENSVGAGGRDGSGFSSQSKGKGKMAGGREGRRQSFDEEGRGTARDGVVVGMRTRGVRVE